MSERYVYRNHSRRSCPSGGHRQPVYKRLRDPLGCAYLEKVGETDTQDLIDSYRDETDINRIVRRYTAGDTSVLARVQGVYFDATGAPSNLTTAFETVNLAKDYFNQLPASVQREFGSLGGFLSAIRTVTDSPAPDRKPDRKPDKKEVDNHE